MEELDLTSEQSDQIQAIYAQSRAENKSLREQMQQAYQLRRSLLASDTDPSQLRQQHQQINKTDY